MSRPDTPTVAIVLAAGEGSRFRGQAHKLRVPFRGRPLAVHAVEHAVAAGFDEVIVVTGAVDLDDVLPDEVAIVRNDDWAKGQAGSLQVGLRLAERLGASSVVVGLADQPLVGADAWATVRDADGAIVTATYDGVRSPPVRLDASVWGLLPLDGDEGARRLMRLRPDLVTEVPCSGQPVDVDTLEDLQRWN